MPSSPLSFGSSLSLSWCLFPYISIVDLAPPERGVERIFFQWFLEILLGMNKHWSAAVRLSGHQLYIHLQIHTPSNIEYWISLLLDMYIHVRIHWISDSFHAQIKFIQLIFIGPMCTWGPIIGSPSLYVRPSVRLPLVETLWRPSEDCQRCQCCEVDDFSCWRPYLVKTVNVVNVVKLMTLVAEDHS